VTEGVSFLKSAHALSHASIVGTEEASGSAFGRVVTQGPHVPGVPEEAAQTPSSSGPASVPGADAAEFAANWVAGQTSGDMIPTQMIVRAFDVEEQRPEFDRQRAFRAYEQWMDQEPGATDPGEENGMQRSFEAGSTEGQSESALAQNSETEGLAGGELSEEELQMLDGLKREDQRIRQHEQAHLASAGPYARGGAQFQFETGPDGRSYAVSGEVNVDVTPVSGDPDTTIRKMNTVRRAALAPTDPSPADRAVAAKAAGYANKAREELAQERVDQAHMGYRTPATDLVGAIEKQAEGADPTQDVLHSTPLVDMSQGGGHGEGEDAGMKEASGAGSGILEARTALKHEPDPQGSGPSTRLNAFA